jgi:8-oxo-dGTP pyrophosphatase MutT (NUDIX family)
VNWIEELKERLQPHALPGQKSQSELAAFKGLFGRPPENVKEAGVLALFYPHKKGWHICFIQRPKRNPNDPHSGQISFPGGKREKSDVNLWYTAIRETEEEIGIKASSIQRIGSLTELYIPVSNFIVYPKVGFIEHEPKFILQEEEVAAMITPPVNHFLHPQAIHKTNMTVKNNVQLKAVPHFQFEHHLIWGATAMMFNELRSIMQLLQSDID